MRVAYDVDILGDLNGRYLAKLHRHQSDWGLHDLQQSQISLLVLSNQFHPIGAVLWGLCARSWLEKNDARFVSRNDVPIGQNIARRVEYYPRSETHVGYFVILK